jgi:hypothetical protein
MPPEERDLDALIDQKLFGHDVEWTSWSNSRILVRKGHRIGIPLIVPGYHMKISDAWKVVEELRERGISLCITSNVDFNPGANNSPELIVLKDEKYCVGIWNVGTQRFNPPSYGKTAPEAICKAALAVLELNA